MKGKREKEVIILLPLFSLTNTASTRENVSKLFSGWMKI